MHLLVAHGKYLRTTSYKLYAILEREALLCARSLRRPLLGSRRVKLFPRSVNNLGYLTIGCLEVVKKMRYDQVTIR